MRRRNRVNMENPPSSHSHIHIIDMEGDAFCFTPTSRNPSTNPINVDDDDDGDLRSITASLLKSAPMPAEAGNFIDLSEETLDFYDGDDELRILRFKPSNTPFGKRRKKTFSDFSVTESGQSSNSKNDPDFVCEICVESKSGIESFRIENCSHGYCTECMVKYVASKLQENVTSIRCPVPDCIGLLEPEYCRPILPPEVFDRWGTALCEAVILGSEKFYCPYKDCSAMLIDDGSEVVRQSECPNCWRMFCAQCKVPWHEGIKCEEFLKLNKDEREKEDIMLMNLAQKKQWRRCPKCRFYVEKTAGCMAMMCRCRTAFCYKCGDVLKVFPRAPVLSPSLYPVTRREGDEYIYIYPVTCENLPFTSPLVFSDDTKLNIVNSRGDPPFGPSKLNLVFNGKLCQKHTK